MSRTTTVSGWVVAWMLLSASSVTRAQQNVPSPPRRVFVVDADLAEARVVPLGERAVVFLAFEEIRAAAATAGVPPNSVAARLEDAACPPRRLLAWHVAGSREEAKAFAEQVHERVGGISLDAPALDATIAPDACAEARDRFVPLAPLRVGRITIAPPESLEDAAKASSEAFLSFAREALPLCVADGRRRGAWAAVGCAAVIEKGLRIVKTREALETLIAGGLEVDRDDRVWFTVPGALVPAAAAVERGDGRHLALAWRISPSRAVALVERAPVSLAAYAARIHDPRLDDAILGALPKLSEPDRESALSSYTQLFEADEHVEPALRRALLNLPEGGAGSFLRPEIDATLAVFDRRRSLRVTDPATLVALVRKEGVLPWELTRDLLSMRISVPGTLIDVAGWDGALRFDDGATFVFKLDLEEARSPLATKGRRVIVDGVFRAAHAGLDGAQRATIELGAARLCADTSIARGRCGCAVPGAPSLGATWLLMLTVAAALAARRGWKCRARSTRTPAARRRDSASSSDSISQASTVMNRGLRLAPARAFRRGLSLDPHNTRLENPNNSNPRSIDRGSLDSRGRPLAAGERCLHPWRSASIPAAPPGVNKEPPRCPTATVPPIPVFRRRSSTPSTATHTTARTWPSRTRETPSTGSSRR